MRYFNFAILAIAISTIFFFSRPYSLYAAEIVFEGGELIEGHVTVSDENGKTILETGHVVEAGDEFISEDNQIYEIISVNGNSAKARILQEEQSGTDSPLAVGAQAAAPAVLKPLVYIYHTHTDECYIPSDGQSVRDGNGSIIRVGDVLADSLRAFDYEVVHSTALHDPHDANAYHRSRRTAMSLMRKEYPDAVFDVHRDSAPLKNYLTIIDGQEVARVLLVVGRQSQNRNLIQNFARNIKAVTDNMHPGLIRGIFIARGNYNQDLSPRSILLEIGTEYNSFEAAQRGVTLLADAIPSALSLSNETSNVLNSRTLNPLNSSMRSSGTNAGSFLSLNWKYLLAATVFGAGFYFMGRKYLLRLLKKGN